jgi:hypothetical protein
VAGCMRLLDAVLYGVQPGDPLLVATACTVLVVTGMIAAYVPAASAVSVDPTQALRSE